MSASQTILNPETPLAWVSKSVAQQVEIVRYVFVGTLAAWIWDYLMSIWDEYRIFRKSGIKAIDIVYLLARFTTFSHIITALLFITAPIEHCHAMEIASAWVAFLAMPLNTLLFFFRIRAIFRDSRLVATAFAILWLFTLAGAVSAFSLHSIQLGPTRYCIAQAKPWISVGPIAIAVYDTAVYLSIGIRLTINSREFSLNRHNKIKVFFHGSGVSRISRSLLLSGQLYYLVTVTVNIAIMISVVSSSVSPIYRSMLLVPNIALQNAMACRVYRQVKLGLIANDVTQWNISDSSRAEVEHRRPISELRFQTRTPATSECPSDDTILAGKLAIVSASACPPLCSSSEHRCNRIGFASRYETVLCPTTTLH
ncbi:hypothetical protein C8Q75DRAFT_726331 [Abortiporus biennis]|nr:hypothetical protein C8Q75DRAFT_726331 [Abortiporus biennis]